MKISILMILVLLTLGTFVTANAAMQPTEYDVKQDDRHDDWTKVSTSYERQTEGTVKSLESRLNIIIAILGAIGVSVLGLLGTLIWSLVKKYTKLAIIVFVILLLSLISVPINDGQCSWCSVYYCRDSLDCDASCYCGGDYTCYPR